MKMDKLSDNLDYIAKLMERCIILLRSPAARTRIGLNLESLV